MCVVWNIVNSEKCGEKSFKDFHITEDLYLKIKVMPVKGAWERHSLKKDMEG